MMRASALLIHEQCIIVRLAHLQAMCGLSTDQLLKTLGGHLIRSEPARLASCRITGTYTVSLTMCRYPTKICKRVRGLEQYSLSTLRRDISM